MNNKSFAVELIKYVLIFVVLFLALGKVELFLKYKAIDDCNKAASIEKIDQNLKATYPIGDVYTECVKNKGIK